jgi:hypothetical protein
MLQDFVYISRSQVMELGRTQWQDLEKFNSTLLAMAHSLILEDVSKKNQFEIRTSTKQEIWKSTLIVPTLVGPSGFEQLRIKIINEKEYLELVHTSAGRHFEKVQCPSTASELFFGYEPKNLGSHKALGVLVSYWAKDIRVVKTRLTYTFATVVLGVVNNGFGRRISVDSHGSNSYFKKAGHGSKATDCTPAQAKEDIYLNQYYREGRKASLLHPLVRRTVNALSTNVFHIAQDANPHFMKMVGKVCTKQILTLGHIPKAKAEDCTDGIVRNYSRSPVFGFVNAVHVDLLDKLSEEQIRDWQKIAAENKWKSCSRILANPDVCLPTTCGYQFVVNDDQNDVLDVFSFFAMNGLGMAMRIEDGIVHHFMGNMFSHQTCLVTCGRNDGNICASNLDNRLVIVGWGTSGGRREVSEAVPQPVEERGDQNRGSMVLGMCFCSVASKKLNVPYLTQVFNVEVTYALDPLIAI